MYYCESCDMFFDEPDLMLYQDAEIGHQSYISVCPHCKNEEISEAVKCAKCGEYVKEIETNGMCVKCVNDLQLKAYDFISKFDAEEREIILDYLNEI